MCVIYNILFREEIGVTRNMILIGILCLLLQTGCIHDFSEMQTVSTGLSNIIPEPSSVKRGIGRFIIDKKTVIDNRAGDAYTDAVDLFRNRLQSAAGISLPDGEASSNVICLSKNGELGNEAYRLDISQESIVLEANSYGGFLYGFYTLLQILPTNIYASSYSQMDLSIPCAVIRDEPRFAYRGLMVDVSRHFFSADTIRQIIDEVSKLKINMFHWHLTDDGGFRFPFHGILTTKSGNSYDFDAFMRKTAYRTGATSRSADFFGDWQFFDPDNPDDPQWENRQNAHGGFYTLEEITSVIEYARLRNVSVIPEFDLPGHCKPLYDYFPTLRCDNLNRDSDSGKPFKPETFSDLCASSSDIFEVLDYMIGQIAEAFDSEVIHIGADEVKINNQSWYDVGPWWFCSRCENKIREITGSSVVDYTHLQNLQSRFLKETERIVSRYGKKTGVWNEAFKESFSPDEKTVMWYWNRQEDLRTAVKKGVKIVNSDCYYYYFDFYQSSADRNAANPSANDWGGSAPTVSLQSVYRNNPVNENGGLLFGSNQWGVQANMWTERITGFTKNGKKFNRDAHLIYMIFPRIAAVAERSWSPAIKKNYLRFKEKIQVQFYRFEAAGLDSFCTDERIAE